MRLPRRLKTLFGQTPQTNTVSHPVVTPAPTPRSEYLRLQKEWSQYPRYKAATLNVLNYEVDVVDCASFLAQFKEIFVDEIYRFSTRNQIPIILDCGANVGTSCLYFKHLYPAARVIAFEPDLTICSVLKKNLAINQLTDVEVVEKAVWTDGCGVRFAVEGADGGSIHGTGNLQTLASIRLRTLLEQEFGAIDMLKLDIEGAEVDVMLDCRNSLENVRNLFVEYHSWNSQEQRLDELLRILRENNYRYHVTQVSPHAMPFINKGADSNMDLQLNIFAYKDRN